MKLIKRIIKIYENYKINKKIKKYFRGDKNDKRFKIH